jgi:hypothetical protein
MSNKNFKGFGDYVEIFRGGDQVDSSGKRWDGNELIDKAVVSFNAAEHQPPLVVGHPRDNEPAFGWVKDLMISTTNGVKTLMAKFEQVVPEFEELVSQGRYKKRSASFYPDGRLRHVGFLGAVPPAVKGLADLKFAASEEEALTFDFEEAAEKDVGTNPGLQKEAKMPDKKNEEKLSFSEADIEAAKAAAKAEAKAETAAEFAEQEKARKKSEELAAIKAFCDQGLADGKILPAWIDGGLATFMESLAGDADTSFAEGDSRPPLAWFMDFMGKLPQAVPKWEVVRKGKAPVDSGNADDIARRAIEFRDAEERAGRTISVTDAVGRVLQG